MEYDIKMPYHSHLAYIFLNQRKCGPDFHVMSEVVEGSGSGEIQCGF